MRRVFAFLSAFILTVAACGEDSITDTTAEAASSLGVVSSSTTTITPDEPTTTSLAPTTTTTTTSTSLPETTTTTLAPVTTAPGLPAALSRSLIPWDEVDQGWVVVLYDATPADYSYHGPWVVYLVDPGGDIYEIRAFTEADPIIGPVEALANDGRQVVLQMVTRDDHERFAASLSLETGLYRVVLDLPDSYTRLGTTLPTGRDVVVLDMNFVTHLDTLSTFRTNGDLFATVTSKPSFGPSFTWLYGLDGMAIVVANEGSMGVYSNDGTFLRSLDVPPGRCEPVRWWNGDTVLARCVPDYVLANLGSYHVLWLVPFDGSEPTRITEMPPPSIIEVDMGHADAWRAGDETILQWHGDCAARGLQVLEPDMSATGLAVSGVTGAHWIHAQDGDDLVIHSISGCGDFYGPVSLIAADGSFIRWLVPAIPGHLGVTAVAAMIPTP